MRAPVTYDASSDSSQTMACATSSGRPPRFIGTSPFHPLDAVGLAAEGVKLGVDVAGPDDIHPDAFGGHFPRQTRGQRVEGALAGRVIHVLVGRAVHRGQRGHVDDRAAPRRRAAWTSGGRPPSSRGTVRRRWWRTPAAGVRLSMSSTRICVLDDPGAVDERRQRSQAWSHSSNRRTTSASTATSAAIATARPPAAWMSPTTRAAACRLVR